MARNPRAAAQRATAKAVREKRAQLPTSFKTRAKATRESYLQGVLNGSIPRPEKRSAEGNSLASAAGKARWGKADKVYEAAFKGYWYHNKANREEEPPEEEYIEDDGEDDDE
jgi:hypothetical protein